MKLVVKIICGVAVMVAMYCFIKPVKNFVNKIFGREETVETKSEK
jgi:hypothetical protein